MNPLEIYIIKSSLSLGILYIFYLLVLRKETSYKWNRIYLLFAAIFSSVVPLLNINIPSGQSAGEFTVFFTPVLISPEKKLSYENPDLSTVISIVYLTIVIVLSFIFLFKMFQILRLVRNNKNIYLNGCRAVLLEGRHSPFSFFNIIFIPKDKVYEKSIDKIISHEKVHIDERHSLDMIILEIITIIQWINPAAWLCRKELIAQHEFIADSRVINNGIEISGYKDILFSYSVLLSGSSVTNNFNSLLKRRFEMLSRKHSEKNGRAKILFSLPLLIALLFIFGCKNDEVNSSTAKIVTSDAGLKKGSGDEPFTFVKQMPEYPGGPEALINFIRQNINYPEIAKRAGIEGKVMVRIIVEKDGSVNEINVIKGIGGGCDQEAVRVCKLIGKWDPGKQDGKNVRVAMVIPIQFKLVTK